MPEEAEVRGSDRSTPEGGAVTGETCKGAMAAVQGTGMAGSSTRKSKSVLVVGDDTDRLLVLANGKMLSSNTTWRDVITRFVVMSRQRYPLC